MEDRILENRKVTLNPDFIHFHEKRKALKTRINLLASRSNTCLLPPLVAMATTTLSQPGRLRQRERERRKVERAEGREN